MKTHIQLITINNQTFDYYIEHTTYYQFYSRVSVLMEQLAVIEALDIDNITFHLPVDIAV